VYLRFVYEYLDRQSHPAKMSCATVSAHKAEMSPALSASRTMFGAGVEWFRSDRATLSGSGDGVARRDPVSAGPVADTGHLLSADCGRWLRITHLAVQDRDVTMSQPYDSGPGGRRGLPGRRLLGRLSPVVRAT
jgi:hypothetical protein